MDQPQPIQSISSHLSVADGRLHIKIRHSLAQWAISNRSATGDATKKITVTRTNGTTRRKETYTTERHNLYAKNPMVKLVDIWCRLKAYAGISGLIKDRLSKMQDMAKLCECSINKLRPALKELARLDWIHLDDEVVRMKSEAHVYTCCQLDYIRRIDRVYTKPQKIHNEKQTHYWLYIADIDDNRKRQAYVFHQSIVQNPELKVWLYGHMQSQGYTIAQAENDPLLVAKVMHNLYCDSFHGRESEMYDYMVEHRPDVNRGVLGMADAWGTCPQNVSYIKKQMVKQCIAFVQKIATISSPDFKHNKHCRVMYNFRQKQTFQAFCDDIVPRQDFGPTELQKFQIPAAA